MVGSLLVFQAGCASRAQDVRAVPARAALYGTFSCEQLHDEVDRIDVQALDAATRVDQRFADNAALILVSGLVWPAALALRADGEQAQRLGMLRGRHDAARAERDGRPCPPPVAVSDPAQAIAMSVWPGDRYIYQLVSPERLEVAVEVSAVRTDRVVMNGGDWAQDPAGNRLLTASLFDTGDTGDAAAATSAMPELPRVVGLLKPRMRLGQSSSGVLLTGVRGAAVDIKAQVVGIGPAALTQGSVPTVTLEWEGRVVDATAGGGRAGASLKGVLVVDSRNGMLVRLQTEASGASLAVDVRLLRVEMSEKRPPPAAKP